MSDEEPQTAAVITKNWLCLNAAMPVLNGHAWTSRYPGSSRRRCAIVTRAFVIDGECIGSNLPRFPLYGLSLEVCQLAHVVALSLNY